MRIGIIGTSNSILSGGYVEGLAAQPGFEVVRIATVGESLGLLYAALLNDEAVKKCDICVMDFAVNEELYIRQSQISLEIIEDYLLACIAKIWSLGCMPALICLPRKDVLAAKSSVLNLYLSISKRLNIPCFNAIELVERIQESSRVSRDFLFKDGGHLNAWFAFQVGCILGSILSSEDGRPWPEAEESWKAFEYHNLPISCFKLTDAQTVQRKSALIDIEMAILKNTSSASITIDCSLEVCGVYFNLVESFGIIAVDGDENFFFDLSNEYPSFGKGLLLSVQALHKTIPCKNGVLRITIPLRSELESQRRPLVRKLVPLGRRIQNEDKVEIGGFLLRHDLPKQFISIPSKGEIIAKLRNPRIDVISEIVHERFKKS